jgi:oligopeptide/dipeptide ABC transporter ATP-binding protein
MSAPPTPRRNILEFDGLRLSYRTRDATVRAIDGVTLAVADGESVGLVGESGSGKSTLARAALGLLPERSAVIESGRILIDGHDVTKLSQEGWEEIRGNPVAIVFQDPLSYLNPVMRVGRQIAESVRRHSPTTKVDARVSELLDLVRLPASSVTAYPHELSGGMRQRVLLAAALACGPRLLIADEPTTALDVTTQAEILALLKDLRQRLGMAMLLISHDLGIVASACERIYVMYAGHTVEWGPARSIFGAPAHPYTEGLVKAAAAARNAQGRFATIAGDPPNLTELAGGCPFVPRCPYAMPECSRAMPEPRTLPSAVAHAVRCWRYEESGRARRPEGAS